MSSTSEARRQIKSGGLRIDHVVLTDERAVLRTADFAEAGVIEHSFGKKHYILLRVA